jgi:hypothetical protein
VTSRRLGLIGALVAGLILSAGTAVAAGGGAAPDLTFTAVGTGDTTAAAQSSAAAAVQAEKNTFVQRTGAACGATLASSQQELRLSSGESAVALSVSVYCGAPATTAFGVLVYGFATSDTQISAADAAIGAATSNESTYLRATGATCTPPGAPASAQTWQLTQGWAAVGMYPANCQASTSSPPPAGSCQVTYTASNWPGGFTADLTITDTGSSAINGWTLSFTFPGDQHITNTWNATVAQSGASVTAANLSYDAVIAPGASQSFGVQGTWSGSDTPPASFTVNGASCM